MFLGILFFLVAFFYASVGFGGASSYLALLVLFNVDYLLIPIIALICNITVVSGNCFNYVRAGYLNWRMFLPPTIASIPFAYLGGSLEIEKELFLFLLFFALLLAGFRLLLNYQMFDDNEKNYSPLPISLGTIIGASLGFLSGLVGIGGGIFLAPILYNLRAGQPKQIVTTSSLFILLNSISGLIAQLGKNHFSDELLFYWPLPFLVLIGAFLANLITIKFLSSKTVAALTAILVLAVALRLGWMLLVT